MGTTCFSEDSGKVDLLLLCEKGKRKLKVQHRKYQEDSFLLSQFHWNFWATLHYQQGATIISNQNVAVEVYQEIFICHSYSQEPTFHCTVWGRSKHVGGCRHLKCGKVLWKRKRRKTREWWHKTSSRVSGRSHRGCFRYAPELHRSLQNDRKKEVFACGWQ